MVDKILVNASLSEYKVKVDLENQIVTLQDGKEYHFDYDQFSLISLEQFDLADNPAPFVISIQSNVLVIIIII